MAENEKRTFADLSDLEQRVVNFRIAELKSTGGALREDTTVEQMQANFAQMRPSEMAELVRLYKDKLPAVEGAAPAGTGAARQI